MKHNKLLAAILAILVGMSATNSYGHNGISVIPYPNSVKIANGTFNARDARFHIDPKIDSQSRNAISEFARTFSAVSGKKHPVVSKTGKTGFNFIMDSSLGKEAYSISSTTQKVTVKASSLNGFVYAIETIKQLLPVEIYGKAFKEGVEWTLPCVAIEDSPRFPYRGLHLDVSRHFYDANTVKRYIDMMVMHKMNYFHWHLTDDQGWRIEIKKYPLLTEIGSKRHGTAIKKDWDNCDNIPYGGYYTQEEVKDIIEYAAAKGVTVIPEIDLPGHMLAALAAYPEYGCTGGPYKVWHRWGISDDVLCIGKDKTMSFLEDILDEVANLFPSEYIHIGGDECPKDKWKECPECQAKIKELGLKDDAAHTAEHYLQSYVTNRIGKFLAERGKRIIGWDEILEGELQGDAIVMSWRGVKGGLEAVRLGHDAIMSPNSHYYLDYYQSLDIESEPFAIGGYLPVSTCYSFEPLTDEMTAEQKTHILGVQANMWTEYIKTVEHLEYMALPRISALSEVQWCNPENKSWERFAISAEDLCHRLDIMGYNYATHMFQTTAKTQSGKENGVVEVSLSSERNVPIEYSITDPDGTVLKTGKYAEPLKISGSCTLSAQAKWDNSKAKPAVLTFKAHKAMGQPYTINGLPEKEYKTNTENLLTDGVRGKDSFTSGEWGGWNNNFMDITIDMSGKGSYDKATICTLSKKDCSIFNPMEITVLTSEDGADFKEVAKSSYPTEGRNEPDGAKEYTLHFPATADRYVRVSVRPLNSLPEWHHLHGINAFMFVDEVIID